MNLITLAGLEKTAERKWYARADMWVKAIAKREGVGFDELRPHFVYMFYDAGYMVEVVFVIPGHAPIKLMSDFLDDPHVRIEDGELKGKCSWFVYRTNYVGSPSFRGVGSLGDALLLARWACESTEIAQWA